MVNSCWNVLLCCWNTTSKKASILLACSRTLIMPCIFSSPLGVSLPGLWIFLAERNSHIWKRPLLFPQRLWTFQASAGFHIFRSRKFCLSILHYWICSLPFEMKMQLSKIRVCVSMCVDIYNLMGQPKQFTEFPVVRYPSLRLITFDPDLKSPWTFLLGSTLFKSTCFFFCFDFVHYEYYITRRWEDHRQAWQVDFFHMPVSGNLSNQNHFL